MGSRCRDSVLCDSHSARKWKITQWNSEHTSIIHFKRTAIKRHVTQYTQQAGNTLNYPLSPNRLTHLPYGLVCIPFYLVSILFYTVRITFYLVSILFYLVSILFYLVSTNFCLVSIIFWMSWNTCIYITLNRIEGPEGCSLVTCLCHMVACSWETELPSDSTVPSIIQHAHLKSQCW